MNGPAEMPLSLRLNGEERSAVCRPDETLIELLRERLGALDVKVGCLSGSCGTCTVLVDGRLARSCLLPAARAQGVEVRTAAGLAAAPDGGEARRIADAGGVQCGYCSPGMSVALTALRERGGVATEREARAFLQGNLCRCTGYSALVQVALDEQERGRPVGADGGSRSDRPAVGRSMPMRDAFDKASGATRYVTDLVRSEPLLQGHVLRSPHPHARVVRIDTSHAATLPGVAAIVTGADAPRATIPGIPFGSIRIADRPLLTGLVRYVGDAVAAVAADTAEQAAAAAAAIVVEYEVLPAALDSAAALAQGAPEIHAGTGNLATAGYPLRYEHGDFDAGLARAERVFEGSYRTQTVQAMPMEPYLSIAEWTDGGTRLTVHRPTESLFEIRDGLAEYFGLSPEWVRVLCPRFGGGFGSRGDELDYLAALLSRKAGGRATRVGLEHHEAMTLSRVRHGAEIRLRTGVMNDGTIVAREMDVTYDTGAYADLGPFVILRALRPLALYPVNHARWWARLVYTNRPVAGAARGFGNPQVVFAVESQLDEIAAALGLDPVELRLRNAVKTGDVNISQGKPLPDGRWVPSGMRIGSNGLAECLRRGAERFGYRPHRGPRGAGAERHVRGMGVACMMHTTGKGARDWSEAMVELGEDGMAVVTTGGADHGGTGFETVMAQIAADALGVPVEHVRIRAGDTAPNLGDSGAHASSRTYVTGTAIVRACEAVRADLFLRAGARFGVAPESLAMIRGVITGPDGRSAPVAEVLAGGGSTMRWVRFVPDTNAPPFAACFAEVEVDRATGKTRVLRLLAAHDVGRAINPLLCRGQVQGGVAQGVGFALQEEIRLGPDGRALGHGLLDYKIPCAADLPEIDVLLVESDEPTGPFGAKGVGETGVIAVAPAIASAIFDATGVRPRELPMTGERVWTALEAAGLDRV